jgi:hypothetical protein
MGGAVRHVGDADSTVNVVRANPSTGPVLLSIVVGVGFGVPYLGSMGAGSPRAQFRNPTPQGRLVDPAAIPSSCPNQL